MQVPSTRTPQPQIPNRSVAEPTSLSEQAVCWLEYVRKHSTVRPDYLYRKALDAIRFTEAIRGRRLAVPSKLANTRTCQAALTDLHRANAPTGLPLRAEGERMFFGPSYVGSLQEKHRRWLIPLLDRGAEVRLHAVTGTQRDGYFYGCNVTFCYAVDAIQALCREDEALCDPLPSIYLWRDQRRKVWLQIGYRVCSPSSYELGVGAMCPALWPTARLILSAFMLDNPTDEVLDRFCRAVLVSLPEVGGRLTPGFILSWLHQQGRHIRLAVVQPSVPAGREQRIDHVGDGLAASVAVEPDDDVRNEKSSNSCPLEDNRLT